MLIQPEECNEFELIKHHHKMNVNDAQTTTGCQYIKRYVSKNVIQVICSFLDVKDHVPFGVDSYDLLKMCDQQDVYDNVL